MKSYDYDVDIMIRVMGLLESLPCQEQNNDYKKIFDMVNTYLSKHCTHHIITDYIDTDVECGQTIRYCEKCSLTIN